MMRYLPDVNLWVALSIPTHSFHRTAMAWTDADPGRAMHFCRYTQQGLLRLLTTAAVTTLFGHRPMTNREAIQRINGLLASDRFPFAPEPVGLQEQWFSFADMRTASPKVWMDAYLAAFAVCGGYRLVTTDKAFKQFKTLDVQVLS